jgi:hypothetical protein
VAAGRHDGKGSANFQAVQIILLITVL